MRQSKDVLRLVVANQGTLDGLNARLAPGIAHGCQCRSVSLAGDNRTDDPHTCSPSNVGDHMVQLQIHVGERLLHVLDMRSGVIEVAFSQA
nr:hypothetical protein [Pseudomonas borbori]